MGPNSAHTEPEGTRSSAAAWLRAGTRNDHLAVEERMDLGSTVRCVCDLTELLRGWSTVWDAVHRCSAGPGTCRPARDELLGASTLSTSWLRADLRALAHLRERRAGCRLIVADGLRAVPEGPHEYGIELARLLLQPAGGWGVAYVLRGSRLGGGVLAPQISSALSLPDGVGTRFLESVGTDAGRDWAAFKLRLDHAQLTDNELESATDAARWTFRWVGDVIATALGTLAGLTS
ncbi:MAG: biliverdin-producing heme oxygenase [Ilumatobacteraceae bacterium]